MDQFYKHYLNIPLVASNKSGEPLGPVVASEAAQLAIANAEEARDLFEIDRFIRLEVTPQSIIGQINKVLFVKDHWIIYDRIQNQILKFDEAGRFLGNIGRRGEGPGEYIQADNIVRVWDDNIAVEDGMRGFVLVYNLNGELVFETPRPGDTGDGGKFIIGNTFIWNQKERFYLADFSTNSAAVPQHVVLDYSKPEGELLFGFGQRYERFENWVIQRKARRFTWTDFTEINHRIWAANPLLSYLDIYSMEGRFLHRIRGGHIDYITKDDYDDTTPDQKSLNKLWAKKQRTNFLVACENLVFQGLNASRYHRLNIYDINGHLLRAGLKRDFLTSGLKGATENRLVAIVPMIDDPTSFSRIYDEEELAKLREAGWDPDNYDEDNEYLCLLKTAWKK